MQMELPPLISLLVLVWLTGEDTKIGQFDKRARPNATVAARKALLKLLASVLNGSFAMVPAKPFRWTRAEGA